MRKKTTEGPAYRWGDIGGRTNHPMDPSGAVFGSTHWPKAQPHERLPFGSKVGGVCEAGGPSQSAAEVPRKPEAMVLRKAEKPATTTGLLTLKDFLDESIRLLGKPDAELNAKIVKCFEEAEAGKIGTGMCRMRANNLLRNAVKRIKA